jgi:hypothetical protein
MEKYDVIVKQILNNEVVPQYIPIFKIYKGETPDSNEISISNANHVNLDFTISTGGSVAPRANYTFTLISTTNEDWGYVLRAKNQEKNMQCYTTEDDSFVYIVVKVTQTYRSLYVTINARSSTSPFTLCSYSSALDLTAYDYVIKEAVIEDDIIMKNALSNTNRSTKNSIMYTEAISNDTYLKFLEFIAPKYTNENIKYSTYGDFIYGELILYIGGLYPSTNPCLKRITIQTQGYGGDDDKKINARVSTIAGNCPYSIKVFKDKKEQRISMYLADEHNSRPTVSVLSCNMLYGSAVIDMEMINISDIEDIEIPLMQDDYIKSEADEELSNEIAMVYQDMDTRFATVKSEINDVDENIALNKITLGYSNKNLFCNTATSQTINGVTFTVNSDGSVTANGTATANAILKIPVTLEKNTSYILSGIDSPSSSTYTISLFNTANWDSITALHTNPSFSIGSADVEAELRCVIYKGYTASNVTFYPMIRYSYVTDDTYEQGFGDVHTRLNNLLTRIEALESSMG